MLEGLRETLITGGFITILLSMLIVVVLAAIVTIYFKFLYKQVNYNSPSTMKRAFAFFYDMIIINFTTIIIGFFYFVFTGTLVETFKAYSARLNNQEQFDYYTGKTTLKQDFNQFELYMVIAFAVVSIGYELFGKVTPGKKFMGIIPYGGDKPKIWQIVVRNIVKIPVIAIWPVFLPISWMNKNRSWIHDLASFSHLSSKKV